MAIRVVRRSKAATAKVKVKKKTLEDAFNGLHEAARRGDMSRKEAGYQFQNALERDDLEAEYNQRNSGGVMTAPPMRFNDPSERPTKGRGQFDRKSVNKMLVGLHPGNDKTAPDPEGSMLVDNEFDRTRWKRFQDLNDAMIIAEVSLKGYRPQESKYWAELQGHYRHLTSKILQSGASPGSDYVPMNLSAQLIPDFRQPLLLGSALPHIQMTSPTFESPLEGVEISPYYVQESTSNTTATTSNTIPNRNLTTSKVTWNARALKVRSWVTAEAEEDSIIAMLTLLRQNIGRALGGGWEDALINSDRSSTHQDNDVTAGSTDHRTSVTGLRQLTQSDALHTVQDSGGRLQATDFVAARSRMGKYADDPMNNLLCVVNTTAMTHLVGDDDYIPLNKAGADATLPRGTVGQVFGAPLLTSGKIRTDVNASGVNSVSTSLNTFTHALQMHRNAFVIGDRRDITIKSAEDIETDRTVVVGTWRGDIQQTYADSDGERCITNIVGITKTLTGF